MMTSLYTLILPFLLSFGAGIIDLSLGMGFGFTVTPIMLLLGYTPLEAVPCVLFASGIGGLTSSYFNHREHNIDLSMGSRAFKIAVFTGVLGIIGAVAGVGASINLPTRITGLYIGVLVMASGGLVLYSKALISEFSWVRMAFISLLGALNKGLTGSGFGPVVTTGAMISGLSEKASVSIQSFSEAIVSIVGFITYLYLHKQVDWPLIMSMSAGVVLASPISARIISRLKGSRLRLMVGALAIVIGLFTFVKYY